ncbi:MAG: collagen binding domain-containing protein [Solirubrobacterales bacterium]
MRGGGISTIGQLGIAALVALVVVLLAPSAASAADGSISGVLTFGGGGGPVAGAEVCAGSGTDSACARSAANGSYQLAGLAPGSYLVSFEASEENPFVGFWPYPNQVTVESGANHGGIDAELVKGGVIEGTVADSTSGALLGDVFICAWSDGGAFWRCDFSAADGSFRILGVYPGSIELVFVPGAGHESKTVDSIPISAGGTIQVEALLLPQEGRISGNVYAASSHTPLGGIAVCAIWAKFHETAACTRTDDSGAYEFFPVPPGQFKVVFSPEPAEVELDPEASPDIWSTQFFDQKPTFAAADAHGHAHQHLRRHRRAARSRPVFGAVFVWRLRHAKH